MARRGWATLVGLLLVLGGAAAMAVHAAGGSRYLVLDMVGRVTSLAQPKNVGPTVPLRRNEPFSVLVLGTERAPHYAGPNLTDSMMVLSYDPKTKTASMLSIPRDLWVNIPHYGWQRINTAYEFGGMKTAQLTVERYVGVPIEYYALVSYPAFTTLVNDVGGIRVNVPTNIYDPNFPNAAENKNTLFQLSKGWHVLNGSTALKFIRERHAFVLGDIQREADQQQALLALKTALLEPRNLLRLPKIISDIQGLVKTNIPYRDLPLLADRVLHLPKTAIRHHVLNYASGSVSNWVTPGKADVLKRHPAAIAKVVAQTFPALLAHLSTQTVQVENGAPTTQDYATYFSTVLQKMGTHTLAPIQAAHTNHLVNHVYLNTAMLHLKSGQPVPTEAYIIGQMLGATATERSMPSSRAQIVVVLGKAFPKVS